MDFFSRCRLFAPVVIRLFLVGAISTLPFLAAPERWLSGLAEQSSPSTKASGAKFASEGARSLVGVEGSIAASRETLSATVPSPVQESPLLLVPIGVDTWAGNSSSTFSTAGNWSGTNTPPQSGDSLTFGAAGTGGLTLNNDLTGAAFDITGITFNTGAGAFVIGNGTTAANAGNAFTLTGDVTNNSASLQTINTPFSVSGMHTFTTTAGGGDITLGGNITDGPGGGGISVVGGGIVKLTGTNSYTGATNIVSGATLQLGNGGATGSLSPSSAITDNGTLVFNRSNTVTQGVDFGAISGTGQVIQQGSGILVLTGTDTFSGGAVVNAGTLQVGDGVHVIVLQGSTGSAGNSGSRGSTGSAGIIMPNGNISPGGNGGPGGPGGTGTAGGNAIVVNGGSLLSFATQATVVAGSGGIGGTGGIGGDGGSGSVTGEGGAGGAGGTGGQGGAGGNAIVFSSGGILDLPALATVTGGSGGAGGSGGTPAPGPATGGGGGNGGNGGSGVVFGAGGSLTNSGTISGGLGGAGGSGGPGGPGGGAAGATGSSGSTGVGVIFSGGVGILNNQSGGIINGGIAMDNFANSVTLETGSTINGALNIGTSTSANLTLTGSGSQIYSGAVAGVTTFSGSLTKNGSGTWTLDQAFTYSQATTVSGGRLLVSGSIAGSTTTVSGNGSTLGGTGAVGAVNVITGAILEGGDGSSASGGLTSGGNVSLASGAKIELTLGPGTTNSSLARTGGNWSFDPNQAFILTLEPGTGPGIYHDLITGLAGNEAGLANIGNWTIATPGVSGVFSYDGAGDVDLTLIAVPEPSTAGLFAAGLPLLGLRRRRSR